MWGERRDYNSEGVDSAAPHSVAVYELYNDAEALLYVGITDSPRARFTQHAVDKWWWWDVCSWEVEWLESREAALAREDYLIKNRHPAYNIAGAVTGFSPFGPLPQTAPDFALVEQWTRDILPKRAGLFDLNTAYIYWQQSESLRPDAPWMWHGANMKEIRAEMMKRASRRDLREHLAFVGRWNAQRLERCLARDKRRRLDYLEAKASMKTAAENAYTTARDKAATSARRKPKPIKALKTPKQFINEELLEPRDLLDDVASVLVVPCLRCTDVVGALRTLTNFSYPPYMQLNGVGLGAELRKLGVKMTSVAGSPVVYQERIIAVRKRKMSADV